MIELYAYPNTYAIGVHMLLHESGVPYRVIDVRNSELSPDQPVNSHSHVVEQFRRASPHMRVPAVQFDNGKTMCESGAIALYLGDTLCNGTFAVSPNSAHRPEYLQWLFYLSSTLQPDVMLQFHPEHYFKDQSSQLALMHASQSRLNEIWPILEQQYTDTWMFEHKPTVVDFCLANVLLWPECFPPTTADYPNLARVLEHIRDRPECAEVLSWHTGTVEHTGRLVPK